MAAEKVAYLGPPGTYAHKVARIRFPEDSEFIPRRDPGHVIRTVISGEAQYGIVPIENSSGTIIDATTDALIDSEFPHERLGIIESLSIEVRLSLMKREDTGPIKKVYSHEAALKHCEEWLYQNLGKDLELVRTNSTAAAAQRAAEEIGSAAVGDNGAADIYGLTVLHEGIGLGIDNVTQFFLVGSVQKIDRDATKTCMAVELKNEIGSLADLLTTFKDHGVNLTRIISRPIQGSPGTYVFLIEIDGNSEESSVSASIDAAASACVLLRILGSYPVKDTYGP